MRPDPTILNSHKPFLWKKNEIKEISEEYSLMCLISNGKMWHRETLKSTKPLFFRHSSVAYFMVLSASQTI